MQYVSQNPYENKNHAQLVGVGAIMQDEFRWATFVKHYRTVEELKVPFENDDSPVVKSVLRPGPTRIQGTLCPYK